MSHKPYQFAARGQTQKKQDRDRTLGRNADDGTVTRRENPPHCYVKGFSCHRPYCPKQKHVQSTRQREQVADLHTSKNRQARRGPDWAAPYQNTNRYLAELAKFKH